MLPTKAFRIFFKSFPDRKGTRGLGDFFHSGCFFGTPQPEQDILTSREDKCLLPDQWICYTLTMVAVELPLSALFYLQSSEFIEDLDYIFQGNCWNPHSMGKTEELWEIKRLRRQQKMLQSVSFDTSSIKALYSRGSSTWMDMSEVAHSHVTVNKNLAQWLN